VGTATICRLIRHAIPKMIVIVFIIILRLNLWFLLFGRLLSMTHQTFLGFDRNIGINSIFSTYVLVVVLDVSRFSTVKQA
jgi:hypothetical protein